MADNVTANSGSGGATFATDDDGVAHHPYVKIEYGGDNTQTKVSTSSPLPVALRTDTGDDAMDDTLDAVKVAQQEGIIADDAAFTPGTTKVFMVGAEFDDAATDSVDEGDGGALRMAANRNLYVNIRDNAGNERGLNVDANGDIGVTNAHLTSLGGAVAGTEVQVDVVAALPAGSNAIGKLAANSGVDIGDVDVTSVLPGTGASNLGKAEDAAHSSGDVGVAAMSVRQDTAAALSGTDGDYQPLITDGSGRLHIAPLPANSGVDIGDVDVTSISAGANLIGDVGISGARTSGGTTLYKNIDVDESEDQVKASGGQVYWIHAMNLSSSVLYLKFYNATAASVEVGTTVPVLTFPIPTQGDTNGAGFVLAIPNGIAFGTAITIAATTGVADNDTGAPGANECVVNLGYA